MTKKLQSITSKFPAIAALALIVLAWYLLCVSGLVPAYMLPSPVNVAKALISDMPLILMHARYTLQEAFYGLCIGILLAFVSATLMDRFLTINRAFYPLMVITQTIPHRFWYSGWALAWHRRSPWWSSPPFFRLR